MKFYFINKSIICLAGKADARDMILEIQRKGQVATLLPWSNVQLLQEQMTRLQTINKGEFWVFLHQSARQLETVLFADYKIIRAAGGMVMNKEGLLLMIYRKGKWDLPKGKIDKGEGVKQAALREVSEETGVQSLKIRRQLLFFSRKQEAIYHTYEEKGKKILKETIWFHMISNDVGPLIPQKSEGIECAEWCSPQKVTEYLKNSYPAIEEVISQRLIK
ncbi:MAG: NUDIX domain-containing protein [Chitinophagales bacterium]|nr:NUDIX domain-containing protein [Chitinophagales bacterium]